jgi:hypothetical protein
MSKCLKFTARASSPLLAGSRQPCLSAVPRGRPHFLFRPLITCSLRRLMPPSPLKRLSSIQRHFTMNTQELKNFLADSPPSTVNLVIKKHFEALSDQQARYAHYISRYVGFHPPDEVLSLFYSLETAKIQFELTIT